jgi:hypothetical protein
LFWNSRLFSWISDFTMFCHGCMLEFHDAVHNGSTLIFVFFSVHPEFPVIQHEFMMLQFFPGLWSWVGPPPGGSSKVQNSSHDLPVYPYICTWDFKAVQVLLLGDSYCRHIHMCSFTSVPFHYSLKLLYSWLDVPLHD